MSCQGLSGVPKLLAVQWQLCCGSRAVAAVQWMVSVGPRACREQRGGQNRLKSSIWPGQERGQQGGQRRQQRCCCPHIAAPGTGAAGGLAQILLILMPVLPQRCLSHTHIPLVSPSRPAGDGVAPPRAAPVHPDHQVRHPGRLAVQARQHHAGAGGPGAAGGVQIIGREFGGPGSLAAQARQCHAGIGGRGWGFQT